MNRLKVYFKKQRVLIDRELGKVLPKTNTRPQSLHRAIRYSVFSGGKRIRPILTIESCIVCGGKLRDVLKAACAVEMVHTSSLIHDDLPAMDDDDYRRGRPSCHKRFGEATAILAGDALLTQAFDCLAMSKRKNLLTEAIRELYKEIGSEGMIGGQEVDLRKRNTKKKSDLDFITEKKTAALFNASLKLGAVFADTSKKKKAAISGFGELLGKAFQLIDDSFDNDGYARLIGRKRSRELAFEYIEKAKQKLSPFGKKADRLKEIADFVVTRKRQ
ncbi:MAG: polyprenyl synthetase family protein [Candidatus Omnitrophica bacterium]|nr:polyprenyl synthetase family protein [Candidatus Omnitrophota bacterium]